MEMANSLIEFWSAFEVTGDIYYHPKDGQWLEENSYTRYIDTIPKRFNQFIHSDRFGNFKDHKFHLSLLPVPYLGDLSRADIIILLLNPGFEYVDYWAETHSKEYRDRLRANLRQEFDGVEYPFLSLDPQFCWHSGFSWWEKKLREVITRVSLEKFGGRYLDALRSLANRMAAIELVPYHAQSFKADPLLKGLPSAEAALPSAEAARHYFQKTLVPLAENGNKTIIVTRRSKAWGVPTGLLNIVRYERFESRNASLSSRSKGGSAILARYGISG